MAINIEKNSDGDVTYKNPPVDRTLFPNIKYGANPEEIQEAVDAWLDDHPEATTTVEDGSILPVKLDSTNSATDGYVLSYNATAEKFEWYDIGVELDEINSDITDLKADLSLKANIDGSYEGMTVGNAEQLLSTTYTEDSTPYLYRTSGGSADIGDREEDVIVGGSVVWNQLFDKTKYPETQTSEGITFTNNGDGSWTINGTATGVAIVDLNHNLTYGEVKSGHKYMAIVGDGFSGSYTTYELQLFRFQSTGSWDVYKNGIIATSVTNATVVQTRLVVRSGATVTNVKCCPQLFDLTAMFGSSVADAIYSAESASAGAGVKLFRSLFPKTYYAYDAGTLKSVEGLTAHKMVGFNQWGEEWQSGFYDESGTYKTASNQICTKNKISCLPSCTYWFKIPVTNATCVINVSEYDYSGAFIRRRDATVLRANGGVEYTTSADCHYININFGIYYGTTYNHDICINLSWSGYRNGEYEAYKEHEYPLDSSLTLRGIAKVDASGNLYYDGDRYLPDGTVERRYGVVDLGTLNWEWNASGYFQANPPSGMKHYATRTQSFVCARYTDVTDGRSFSDVPDKSIYNLNVAPYLIGIKDSSYSDASALIASLSGVYLLYEKTTPTTETADPYQAVQICNDWGTEEYVIDEQITIPVPVGHETRYPANLRDKLQHLPDLANADGYYLIKQEGTQMTLELFRIPKAPETDGTYMLKATVSGGQPTYTWEVVS